MAGKEMSRREFLKKSMVGAAGLASMGILGSFPSMAEDVQESRSETGQEQQPSAEAGTGRPSRIIDVHTHILPAPMNARYVEWLQKTGTLEDGPFFLWTDPAFEDVANHLREMDQYGIDCQLAIHSSNVPNIIKASVIEGLDEETVIRNMNDGMVRICDETGGRVIPAAWIDPNLGQSAIREMERMAGRGVRAFGVLTAFVKDGKGRYLDHPDYHPFWERVNRIGLPVFTHFSTRFPLTDPEVPLIGYNADLLMTGGVSVLVENTLFATRMVFSGLLDKYPDLKIVLGQLGGLFPFMLGRYDMLYGIYAAGAARSGIDVLSKKNLENFLRNLKDYTGGFYTDSHSMSREAIACAIEILGKDKVMFGSDYPITPAGFGRKQALDGLEAFPADPEIRENFYHRTAEKLLKL